MTDNSQSRQQTLTQERAALAWDQIGQVPESVQDKYGTWARKLPTLIQSNGLGASMAFLLSKAKRNKHGDFVDGYGYLYVHIEQRICNYLDSDKDLMSLIRSDGSQAIQQYRRATVEAIEFGLWLRRYVEGSGWGSATGDDNS